MASDVQRSKTSEFRQNARTIVDHSKTWLSVTLVTAVVLYFFDPAPLPYLLVMPISGLLWAILLALGWRTEQWTVYLLLLFSVYFGTELPQRVFRLTSQIQEIQGLMLAIGSAGILFVAFPEWISKFSRLPAKPLQTTKPGKAIMTWSEPVEWQKAATHLARSEGINLFPWLTWLMMSSIFTALIVMHWRDADPLTRFNIPTLIGVLTAGFGLFAGLGWLLVGLNSTNSTTIHKNGIIHGSKFKKQWYPWNSVEYYYVEEERLEGKAFRFLTWKINDDEEEAYSVIPESVDTSSIIRCFKDNQIEQSLTPNND